MKIKSDKTPKLNKLSEWMKKHKTSDISKTVMFGTMGLAGVMGIFLMLMSVNQEQESALREHEDKQVEKIIAHKPVIKCANNHYLPEEYELEIDNGRNVLKISHELRKLNETFFLSNCNLILTKTQLTVTDSFRKAVFKKRGFITATAKEEAKLQSQALAKLEFEKREKEKLEKSKIKEEPKLVFTDDTKTTIKAASIHSEEYYMKLEYASLYPNLVKALTELIAYHNTDEYKELKKKRFAQNKTTKKLNRAYNKVRPRMWVLHQRFGTRYGSYSDLESGKLTVVFFNGKLEFGGNV